MKIALCLEYPIAQFGGTEVLVSELLRGLAGKHEIVLVSKDDSAALKRSPRGAWVTEHIHWDSSAISTEKAKGLAEDLAGHRVDLAHFHFGGNYGWGNRYWRQCPVPYLSGRGVPCISTNHGAFSIVDGYCGPQKSLPVKLALFIPAWMSKQVVLKHLKTEVAVSQHDYHALRRWYPLMRSKFRQIYHSRIQKVELNPETQREKIVLCVGSIGLRKGQVILARAFRQIAARHRDWKLVLIGRPADAELTREIRETMSSSELAPQLHGPVECSEAELPGWLKKAEIFAMPSFREGLGLSLQEALAHGCACVGSRIGGIPDLIQDGDNGLLVAPGNVEQLAEALERLIGDSALRSRFRVRAPKSILEKDMTAEKMVDKYATLYRQILGQG